MAEPKTYDYTRYLTAKRSIDERSINRRVWQRFVRAINQEADSVRILEVGGGIGATAERILAATEVSEIHYTLVDLDEANVSRAYDNLRHWAQDAGYEVDARTGALSARRSDQSCIVDFIAADAFDFAEKADAMWDVLVAQAFLDLVNLRGVLTRLLRLLSPRALLYFPIHFDGLSVFEPVDNAELNRQIVEVYHDTMDERSTKYGSAGGSRTGRALLMELRQLGAPLLDVGSSDWVIAAGEQGFSAQERYFLHHILHFVETSVKGHPVVREDELTRWIRKRRRQTENDTLIYIAHQLDILARHEG